MPSAERLRELFEYRPLTGELVNRVTRGGVEAGRVAGYKKSCGYWEAKVDDHSYKIHRLIWAWFHGNDPIAVIHHKRADKRNTIWDLENVSHRRNCSIEKTEASGLPVGVKPSQGRYQARIWYKDRTYYLGYYDTPEEASEAYQRALARVNQGLPPQAVEKDFYVGTRWKPNANKWQARIQVDGKGIHLGYFADRCDAVNARIAAEVKYLGKALPRKEKS